MIKFELLKDIGVLVLEPKNALSTDDFQEISRVIDPYIREKGKLTGLLIEAASFPGWDSDGEVGLVCTSCGRDLLVIERG